MKTLLICTLFLSIPTSYANSQNNELNQIFNETVNFDKENNLYDYDLNGTWVNTNYLDSILENKSIAKYRKLPASLFAILLDIRNDSLSTYGSIYDNPPIPISKTDMLCTISRTLSGKYSLIFNEKNRSLALKQIDGTSSRRDTITYIFKQRNDLAFLSKNPDPVHKTNQNFTKYFNQQLIQGRYTLNNIEVAFLADSKIENFLDYSKYQVYNYFGTLHPFKGLDVLFLSSPNGEMDCWHWKIFDKKLILTKLKTNGENSDEYEQSNEIIELIKK